MTKVQRTQRDALVAMSELIAHDSRVARAKFSTSNRQVNCSCGSCENLRRFTVAEAQMLKDRDMLFGRDQQVIKISPENQAHLAAQERLNIADKTASETRKTLAAVQTDLLNWLI